jgi:hypothetical protein
VCCVDLVNTPGKGLHVAGGHRALTSLRVALAFEVLQDSVANSAVTLVSFNDPGRGLEDCAATCTYYIIVSEYTTLGQRGQRTVVNGANEMFKRELTEYGVHAQMTG